MSEPGCGKVPRHSVPGVTWTVLRIPAGQRGQANGAVFGKPVTVEDLRRLLDEDDE